MRNRTFRGAASSARAAPAVRAMAANASPRRTEESLMAKPRNPWATDGDIVFSESARVKIGAAGGLAGGCAPSRQRPPTSPPQNHHQPLSEDQRADDRRGAAGQEHGPGGD